MGRQTRSSLKNSTSAAADPTDEPDTHIGKRTRSCNAKTAAADPPAPKSRSAPARPQTKKKRKKPKTINRQGKSLQSYTLDGEEYRVGDNVYLALENFTEEQDDDETERCQICRKMPRSMFILECSSCLRGYHGRCMNPPVKAIPQGDWLCPRCNSGRIPDPPNPPRTALQMVLYGDEMMALARIETIVENRNGSEGVELVVQFYSPSDKTHLGRQKPFRAREMFLVKGTYYEPAECIYAKATVCSAAEFADTAGDDVFLCEFMYDATWKRFTRLGQEELEGANSDIEWGGSDAEDDMTYQPDKDITNSAGKRGKQLGQWKRQGQAAAIQQLQSQALPGGLQVPQGAAASPFAALKNSLSPGTSPAELPCRDEEKGCIKRFITDSIIGVGRGNNVLYICGVPGTGKTASLIEVIFSLRGQLQEAGVQFVALNGLQLPSPQHIYSKLWEKVTGQQASPARALTLLEQQFTDAASGRESRLCPTLIVVDEVDVLMTKDQAVLYNLFEWPMRPGSRLCVVAVSNTHDLDERVLPRIASRLASSKLVFKPYNVEQLAAIVRQRVEVQPVVIPAAIQFAAAKVSGDSGDARRVLELMRRAVEVAEAEHSSGSATSTSSGNKVTVRHVNEAIKEMYNSVHMQYLRTCSLLEKMLLVGIAQETRAISKPECTLQGAVKRIPLYCQISGTDEVPLSLAIPAAWRLHAKRLILAGHTSQHLKMKVALNVQTDDIAQVIKADTALQQLGGFL